MSVEPSTASPSAADPTPAGSRPRRATSGARWALAIGAVVVAVVVLLALVLVGSAPKTPTPSVSTFEQARAAADAVAGSVGDWILVEAYGVGPNETVNLGPTNLRPVTGCNTTVIRGSTGANVTWPAFHGNLSSGTAGWWSFAYLATDDVSVLFISVTGEQVGLAFEQSGANCPIVSEFVETSTAVGGAIDSPNATAVALAAGGLAFLTKHRAGVSLSMELTGRGGWYIDWTTCSLLPDAFGWFGQGSEFAAQMNATSGALIPGGGFNGTCGGPPPIGSVLQYGAPSLTSGSPGMSLGTDGCNPDDFCYRLPIVLATHNVSADNLSLGVDAAGNGLNGVVGYAILDSAGNTIAWYSGPYTGAGGSFGWTPVMGSGATLLNTSMTLTVDMGSSDPSGNGYELVTSGYGAGFASSPYYAVSLP